jgi:hypothetical protein
MSMTTTTTEVSLSEPLVLTPPQPVEKVEPSRAG